MRGRRERIARLLGEVPGLGTVILLAGWLIARVFPTPRARHALGLVSLYAALASPLWCALADWSGATSVRIAVPSEPLPPVADVVASGAEPQPPSESAPVTNTSPGALVVGWVYLLGVLVGLARYGMGEYRVRRAIGRSTGLTDARVLAAMASVLAAMRLKRVQTVESPDSGLPFVARAVRPVLVIPAGLADRLDPDELRSVLAHELAHVRFQHLRLAAFERLARIALWPHVPLHLLARDLAAWREEMCDDAGADASDRPIYSRALVKVAECALRAPLPTLSLFGSRLTLRRRVQRLMQRPRRSTRTMSVSFVASFFTLAGFGAVGAGTRIAQEVPPLPPATQVAASAAAPTLPTPIVARPAKAPLVSVRATGDDGRRYVVEVVGTKKGKVRRRVREEPAAAWSRARYAAPPVLIATTVEAPASAVGVPVEEAIAVTAPSRVATPSVGVPIQAVAEPAQAASAPIASATHGVAVRQGAATIPSVAEGVVVSAGQATSPAQVSVSVPPKATATTPTLSSHVRTDARVGITTAWSKSSPASTAELAARVERLQRELEQLRAELRTRDASTIKSLPRKAPARPVQSARPTTRQT